MRSLRLFDQGAGAICSRGVRAKAGMAYDFFKSRPSLRKPAGLSVGQYNPAVNDVSTFRCAIRNAREAPFQQSKQIVWIGMHGPVPLSHVLCAHANNLKPARICYICIISYKTTKKQLPKRSLTNPQPPCGV